MARKIAHATTWEPPSRARVTRRATTRLWPFQRQQSTKGDRMPNGRDLVSALVVAFIAVLVYVVLFQH